MIIVGTMLILERKKMRRRGIQVINCMHIQELKFEKKQNRVAEIVFYPKG
jgi:hypothetical protein